MVYEPNKKDYKTDMKEIATARTGTENALEKIAGSYTKAPSPLEKIAGSYTKMPDVRSGTYNIDNCNCGNCGCVQGNMLLVLSPVGIAATVSAFGPISAM